MKSNLTREEAYTLLRKYNKEAFLWDMLNDTLIELN